MRIIDENDNTRAATVEMGGFRCVPASFWHILFCDLDLVVRSCPTTLKSLALRSTVALGAAFLYGSHDAVAADVRPWQQITVPTCREAALLFTNPPPEYDLTIWWWWNGNMSEDEIVRDLRDIQAHGFHSVMLWAYYGLSIEYLSEQWFQRVRFAVEQARRMNIRVWLMDEGSYPSGFAGGKISREHPELRMQALAASPPLTVAPGGAISFDVPVDTIAVIATDQNGNPTVLNSKPGTTLHWSAPGGGAKVTL
jgi:hypothetical protein